MPKGNQFTETERSRVRELVLKYKDKVENKQSDSVSIKKRRDAWDTITIEFNANTEGVLRTVEQLKKLWENIKFRRKAEFAAERRNLLKTGGGPSQPNHTIESDPELDSCGIATEISDVIDSDTVQLIDNDVIQEYLIVDDTLQLKEAVSVQETTVSKVVQETTRKRTAQMPDETNTEGNKKKRSKLDCFSEEADLRIEKASYILSLEKEIGQMRKEEQALNIELLRQKLETARCDEEFFKEKRKLELALLQKKLFNYNC